MKIVKENKNNNETLPVWLYKKEMSCPSCGRVFFDSYPRYTRLRIDYVESDLRPHYVSDIFPFPYDVTVCYNCGYSMLTDSFSEMNEWQRKRIRDTIMPKFQSRNYPLVLTRELADERYKLAQLSIQVMGLKESEKAYFMLRSAWFYKNFEEKSEIEPNHVVQPDENTLRYYRAAVEGFEQAYVSEPFPIRGMNEVTLAYLIALLYYRLGDLAKASMWLKECYSNRSISTKENRNILEKINALRRIVNAENSEFANLEETSE